MADLAQLVMRPDRIQGITTKSALIEFNRLKAVGRLSCNQNEKDSRQELDEAHETWIEWTLGDVVDLPANGDRLHLQQ